MNQPASRTTPQPSAPARATLYTQAAKRALKRLGVYMMVPFAFAHGFFNNTEEETRASDYYSNRTLARAYCYGEKAMKVMAGFVLLFLAILALFWLNHIFNLEFGLFTSPGEFKLDVKAVTIIAMLLVFLMCLPTLVSTLAITLAYFSVFISIVWSAAFITAYLLVNFDIHVQGPISETLVFIITLGGLL